MLAVHKLPLIGEWWTQVPVLALAAEYFFKLGVEGKRFRPTVLTLLCNWALLLLYKRYFEYVLFIDSECFTYFVFSLSSMGHMRDMAKRICFWIYWVCNLEMQWHVWIDPQISFLWNNSRMASCSTLRNTWDDFKAIFPHLWHRFLALGLTCFEGRDDVGSSSYVDSFNDSTCTWTATLNIWRPSIAATKNCRDYGNDSR